jgi:heat-inducible transcriptional repressor
LTQAAGRLNSALVGLSVDGISAVSNRSDALEQDIILLLIQDMKRTSENPSGEIYTDGLTNVLNEPEFAESDEARWAMRLFEERSILQDLIARASTNSNVGGLQVLIGGVGGWEELRQCSMVIARYGAPGLATGTLGVLGPMRMSYARTIPTVRYVAGLLSDLVIESNT